jgi:hypothetical protein
MSSLLVTADVRISRILSTLKVEATLSSETSFLTRSIRSHIQEDSVLQNVLFMPGGYMDANLFYVVSKLNKAIIRSFYLPVRFPSGYNLSAKCGNFILHVVL